MDSFRALANVKYTFILQNGYKQDFLVALLVGNVEIVHILFNFAGYKVLINLS